MNLGVKMSFCREIRYTRRESETGRDRERVAGGWEVGSARGARGRKKCRVKWVATPRTTGTTAMALEGNASVRSSEVLSRVP
jgi:hypothetical protein